LTKFISEQHLFKSTPAKIVMLVVDGLGGLPNPSTGKSELETAKMPNIDKIASNSSCGLTIPVKQGITPGSGPGHLSLFGYDPIEYPIGRGVLEGLGIGLNLAPDDIAVRGNFCTIDNNQNIVDRRASRISSAHSKPLCDLLNQITIPNVEIEIVHVKEHRFVLLLRGQGLSHNITSNDPEEIGVPSLKIDSIDANSAKTASIVEMFIKKANQILEGQNQANGVLLRGFSKLPNLPSMASLYNVRAASIAAYPMYRGLTQLLGMDIKPTGSTFEDEIITLKKHYSEYDFFYIHYKPADAAGEDGDFNKKVRALEHLDGVLPQILELNPDVFVIAGDHSTPSIMGSHSWHPVPVLIKSSLTIKQGVTGFDEKRCLNGSLGTFNAVDLMSLILAHAGKISKFGP